MKFWLRGPHRTGTRDWLLEALQDQERMLEAQIATHARALRPPPEQALPMAFVAAQEWSNIVVTEGGVRAWGDHLIIYRALAAVLLSCLEPTPLVQPQRVEETHQFFSRWFDLHRARAQAHNARIALERGYWRVDNPGWRQPPRLTLAEAQRTSALDLLAEAVDADHTSPAIARRMDQRRRSNSMSPHGQDPQQTRDVVEMHMTAIPRHLAPLRESVPEQWQRFIQAARLDFDELVRFSGFCLDLARVGEGWFRERDLERHWKRFRSNFGLPIAPSRPIFTGLVQLFSHDLRTLDLARPFPVLPFLRVDQWLFYWPYWCHGLPPALRVLDLFGHKLQDLWSPLVQSRLAAVADWLGARLRGRADLVIETRRHSPNRASEVDLAIYDPTENHLVLCELKTTYDSRRISSEQSKYVEGRADFPKAVQQLRRARGAIADGSWPLADLLGGQIDERVRARTTSLIMLTWWEMFNPLRSSVDDDVLCCNYQVFEDLLLRQHTPLSQVIDAIRELDHLYCPSLMASTEIFDRRGRQRRVLEEKEVAFMLPDADRLVHNRLAAAQVKRVDCLKGDFEAWARRVSGDGKGLTQPQPGRRRTVSP